jgi:hypothetical protein
MPAPDQSLARTAREACARAAQALAQARQTLALTRQFRRARDNWRRLRPTLPTPPDVVVCCAFCARVRAEHDCWLEIPAEISRLLHGWEGVAISHGFCPDCVTRHFFGNEPAADELLGAPRVAH